MGHCALTFFSIQNSAACVLLNRLCFTSAGNQVLQADTAAAEQSSAGCQATRPPQTAEQKLERAPTNFHPKALQQTNHALPQTALFEDAIRERHLVPSPTAQSLPGGEVSPVGGWTWYRYPRLASRGGSSLLAGHFNLVPYSLGILVQSGSTVQVSGLNSCCPCWFSLLSECPFWVTWRSLHCAPHAWDSQSLYWLRCEWHRLVPWTCVVHMGSDFQVTKSMAPFEWPGC